MLSDYFAGPMGADAASLRLALLILADRLLGGARIPRPHDDRRGPEAARYRSPRL
jgi:hypothetical protein